MAVLPKSFCTKGGDAGSRPKSVKRIPTKSDVFPAPTFMNRNMDSAARAMNNTQLAPQHGRASQVTKLHCKSGNFDVLYSSYLSSRVITKVANPQAKCGSQQLTSSKLVDLTIIHDGTLRDAQLAIHPMPYNKHKLRIPWPPPERGTPNNAMGIWK